MPRAPCPVIALAGAALLLGACGGGDDASKSGPLTARPTPKRPISAEVAPFNREVAAQRCKGYWPFVLSLERGLPPGAPVTAAECRHFPTPGVRALRTVRFTRAQAYGTAALLESPGPAGPRARYALWALDSDGRFRFTELLSVAPPQFDSAFSGADEATTVANRFVEAVRKRDCRAMEPLFSSGGSRLVFKLGSRRAACQAVIRGAFLTPAVQKTPRVRVEALGRTRSYGVVGIATRSIYFTMLLGPDRPGLRVLDVVPSTPVKYPTR